MTMTIGFFIFAVGFLSYVQSVYTSLDETVWLKDVTTKFQTDKRTLRDNVLPDGLTFRLKRGTDALTLNLKRNYDINPNANVYVARTLKDGQSVLVKTKDLENEDVAYYQDKENGAFMTVRCVKRSNELCDKAINGNIRIGESIYNLRPAETDVTSRNMFEFPGRSAKPYILQHQAQIQSKNLAENTDTSQYNENRLEEDFITFLRNIEGQLKREQFSPSDATSSSKNVAGVHNRGATDTSRQLTDVYHVKVAVLIESGIWDLYTSLLTSKGNQFTQSQVKRKIRESFSHVMNGVNLRYKGINDPSISINVILSDFIFFPRIIDLTNPFKIKSGIIVIRLIFDLSKSWDNSTGKHHMPFFDHGMLFTSFRLKVDDLRNPDVRGISITGGICDVGDRFSIVEAGDFVWMTWAAAHELGHNLGSWHDGEEDSEACKDEDYFVMTSLVPKVDSTTPYPRNTYIFSNCSVESFKKTLKKKECVTRPGKFHKEADYNKFVKVQPGEVYTPDDQCLLIMGAKSTLCKTDRENICHLMRCKDHKTGMCMEEYYSAASGTNCGPFQWCFEGKCVKAPDGSGNW